MGRAFLVIVIVAGILPVLWLLCKLSLPAGVIQFDWLLWPSPTHAYRWAFDRAYSGYHGAREFWISIGAMAGLGAMFLAGAMYLLPRVWQERGRWGRVETPQVSKGLGRFRNDSAPAGVGCWTRIRFTGWRPATAGWDVERGCFCFCCWLCGFAFTWRRTIREHSRCAWGSRW
jgi:hypothetical protein